MKKILAVSGGIDSVVLLHQYRDDKDTIVAHFDHGIRPSSAEDCAFVSKLAEFYRLPFLFRRAHLGKSCSEAAARTARYCFLRSVAKQENGQIYTAHHADDALESVIINLLRGTGWRGLAPLGDPSIKRPLLDWSKSDIYRYAATHQLSFRLDPTNNDNIYLRNRVRCALLAQDCDQAKAALLKLFLRQRELAQEVDCQLEQIIGASSRFPRALFASCDEQLSQEILRYFLKQRQLSLTRPQLQRAIAAIRDFKAGKRFSLGTAFLVFGRQFFWVEQA